MTRQEATRILREEMSKHGLDDWSVRLNQNAQSGWIGLCMYRDKCILLNAHHIDIHPDPDVINTIRHEIAHAIVGPGHGHDEIWAAKAREVGCDNTMPCSNLSLTPQVIDAIRSGADVEVTFEEQVIRTPKYQITRLQDKCPYCGKVAKSVKETLLERKGDTVPDLKYIHLDCGHTLVKQIPKGTPFHLFQMGGDPNCEHEWDKNTCIKCDRKRPYPFQLEGMKFLEAALAINKGGCCFDDMGLGKTIQAGGVLKYHPEYLPALWVAKKGLHFQIASFIINWLGNEHVPQIVETSQDYLIPGLKHYIIGYDMMVAKTRKLKSGKIVTSGFDITKFEKIGIKLVVLDECQQISNVDSSRTQQVRKLVKNTKILPLSGTPWNNRGTEYFPVLNMVAPTIFHSEELFKRVWVDTYMHGNIVKTGGIKNIPKFKELTKDIIIRRERPEVMPELPTINRTKLHVKMDPAQAEVYDQAVEEFVEWYTSQAEELSGMAIIAAMQKMRHLVALAKIPATMEYVEEFVEDTDRKLVVFAHHKDVQALLYDEIYTQYGDEFYVCKITAEMGGDERFEVQQKFNGSKRAIMVASMLAAGEGLNLQTCADCVIHERMWNPGKEEQAEGRFIRIGQTSTSVNAVYAHMNGLTTIDPQLDEMVARKRANFHAAMNKGEMIQWNEEEVIKELAQSIVNAHNAKKNRKILKGATA